MKRKVKYILTTVAAFVMMIGSLNVTHAVNVNTAKTGWEEVTVNREKEWVYWKNGKMVKSDWVCSPASGLWYYMDEDGYMLSNCWGHDKNSEGYWFDASGVMATGWRLIDLEDEDEDYSYGPGSAANKDNKGYFYFNSSGMVYEGWLNLNGTYYFMNDGYVDGFEDYQMVYGIAEIDGDEYYFGEAADGSMKKGKVKVITEKDINTPGGSTTECYYLYQDNGVRVTEGWGKYDGTWYYISEKGEIATERFLYLNDDDEEVDEKDAEAIYYMDKEGKMKTGWLELGEEKEIRPGEIKKKSYYYFKSNGVMWTGWLNENGKYYYLREQSDGACARGELVTGLYEIGDDWYYFGTDGVMAKSAWKDIEDNYGDEHSIYLGSKGVMVKADTPASLAYATINSKLYFFDSNGYCIESRGTIIVEDDNKYLKYNGNEAAFKADSNYKAGTAYYLIGSGGSAKRYKK